MAEAPSRSGVLGTIAIRVLATVLALAGIGLAFGVLFLISWIGNGTFINVEPPRDAHVYLLAMIVLDAALWACAVGLLAGKRWAWIGALVLALLGVAAFATGRLPGSAGLYGVLLTGGAVVALVLPDTRRRFGL